MLPNLFEYMPRSSRTGSIIALFLVLWGISVLISIVVIVIYIPTNRKDTFLLQDIFTRIYFCILGDSYFTWIKMNSQYVWFAFPWCLKMLNIFLYNWSFAYFILRSVCSINWLFFDWITFIQGYCFEFFTCFWYQSSFRRIVDKNFSFYRLSLHSWLYRCFQIWYYVICWFLLLFSELLESFSGRHFLCLGLALFDLFFYFLVNLKL